MIRGASRQLVHRQIQEALHYYSKYKKGVAVPHLFKAYLDVLEEDSAIYNYTLGLNSYEHKVVTMYLDEQRPEQIAGSREFKSKNISINDIRIWIFGNREVFGLVNTMFSVFMKQSNFCPFCHDSKRFGNKSYVPKHSGTVCPHREMWEQEMMEGCDA